MNDRLSRVSNELAARFRVDFRAGHGRVWILTLIMGGAASVLSFSGLRNLPSVSGVDRIPWLALAALFYLTEVCVIRFHFRREAQSFSLNEIAIVLGLFFISPLHLIFAQLCGSAIALIIHRRQSILKVLFNLSHWALGTSLGIILFRSVAPRPDLSNPLHWGVAYVATLIASLVGFAAITSALSLSEGKFDLRRLTDILLLSAGGTLTNTGVGLIAATVLVSAPKAAWLLLIPVSTLFAAYRAFMSERKKKESIEFLYESTSIIHRSPDVDSAICALMTEARKMFRCEIAEVILLPASSEEQRALRVIVGPDDDSESIKYVDLKSADYLLSELSSNAECVLYPKPMGDTPIESKLKFRGIRDAMSAGLLGETRAVGAILIANRRSDVGTFDQDDLQLLQSLAAHLSVALEYGRLESSLSELKRLQEELTHQAYHDSLTGLANRALFQTAVEEALEKASREGTSISVLFVDLDDFKAINDTMGHAAGDELLAEVGRRISSSSRSTDIPARLGGDEFAILLHNTQLKDAVSAANRIREALREPVALREKEVAVHASVGVAVGGRIEKSSEEFLRHADVAMYKAKSLGKDRYEVFEPSMQEDVNRRQEMKENLIKAINAADFVVEYQPIVELVSNSVAAAEALVRWNHPDNGMMGPGDFIPLAEETGLVLPIGNFVLKQACMDAKAWRHPIRPGQVIDVSVNLSGRQLQHPGFPAEVAAILEETQLDPHNLILEITESVLVQDVEATVESMHALKNLGLKLAIDDFGTGYSSLSYLRKFPVDYIKIAKPFVDDLVKGRNERAFVEGIIALGRIMGLKVIGEGVEYVEQKDYLRDMNCDLGQGHFFAKSVASKEFFAFLKKELTGFERFSRLEEQYDESPPLYELIPKSGQEVRTY